MKIGDKFINLNTYKQLLVDRIIFESYYPIIFTCLNKKGDLFICVCYQHNCEGCGWLVGKTTPNSVIDFLQNRISLRNLLSDCTDEKYTAMLSDGSVTKKQVRDGWSDDNLPKVDSFLDAEDGEFDEEIEYYVNLQMRIYLKAFYKGIFKVYKKIGYSEADSFAEKSMLPVYRKKGNSSRFEVSLASSDTTCSLQLDSHEIDRFSVAV